MGHISATDAPTFDLPGCTFTGLASPSRGCTQTSVWTLLPVGGRASLGDGEYFVPPWAA